MCGIFGSIGPNINSGIIRALAIANRERGIDSIGLFDNTGKYAKIAQDPLTALRDTVIDGFIERASCKGWFLAGHTRNATHGSVITANAHPFRYGSIIGAHNGIVIAPKNRQYPVDSQYLFDRLNQAQGDYQTAFADIDGYWGLQWFDGCNFYLQAHDNQIAIGRADDGNYYYSSDEWHLAACIGRKVKLQVIDKGATIRFSVNSGEYQVMPTFRSALKVKTMHNKRYLTGTLTVAKKPKKAKKPKLAIDTRYDDPTAWLSSAEWAWGNQLAEDAGYTDLATFMSCEGITDEWEALNCLEDCAWADRENEIIDAEFTDCYDIPF